MTGPPQRVQRPNLEIAVDRRAEIPLGVQLAWALRTRIADGRLTPGERLPGLRELAADSGVNVNTVRAVYQRLEQEGLIDSQQGSGTFVAATAGRPSAAAAIAADAAREAHESGVDPREVAAALYVSPAPNRVTDRSATRRRSLREQIASLERTLGEIEARHPEVVKVVAESPGNDGPLLLDVAALERVRTLLVRRLSAAQAAADAARTGQSSKREEPPARSRRPARAKRASSARATIRPAPEGT